MDWEQKLGELESQVTELLAQAGKAEDFLQIKQRFLGKQGEISNLLKGIREIPPEVRPVFGQRVNQTKQLLEERIAEAARQAESGRAPGSAETLDLTLPGVWNPPGSIHPIAQVLDEIREILEDLGFQIAEGPEIETDYYNFEALNIPKGHPARDMQDSFYIEDEVVLRTQTSPVQIRVMEKQKPPLRIYAPGRVYRRDMDVSHTPMFHQVEGLWVDRGITFSDLKGVLMLFAEQLFGEGTPVRFRPSFFPFTEPSAEVDIQCHMCRGKGCRVCGNSGWLEILGAGMVHPGLFRRVGYDPAEFTGFAFGMGVERVAMLKFGINDIRLFFENDLRFLKQF
jgi:phenylalanyl-tRNA synthetase alpha chain